MMFSKLSILFAATLVALATAASVPQNGQPASNGGESKTGGETKCPGSSPVCCASKHLATVDDVNLVQQTLGHQVIVGTDMIWNGCSAQKSCGAGLCCDKIAADLSIAIGCKDAT